MTGQHAFLAPSSAEIWGPVDGCHAYPRISQNYPEEETEDSIKGKATHWLGSQMIEAKLGGKIPMPTRKNLKSPDGVVIDFDMYDSAQIYARDVIQVFEGIKGEAEIFVERQIPIPEVHPEQFGTPDCVLIGKNFIHVWDFKNGHVPVDVFGNWQMINYLAGLFTGNGKEDQHTQVFMTVVQPQANDYSGPIKKWNGMMSDLRGRINTLKSSAEKCYEDNPVVRSGPHCRYCPARFECAPAIEGAARLYEAVGFADTYQNAEDPAIISANYVIVSEMLERVKALEKGMRERIESMLKAGIAIPGRYIEPTFGRETWTAPYEEVVALGDCMGVDLRKEALITPKQAASLFIEKNLDTSILKPYRHTPQTGGKLAIEDLNKIRSIFYGRS